MTILVNKNQLVIPGEVLARGSGVNVAGGIVVIVGDGQVGIAANCEKLPVSSASGRDRLALNKARSIPAVYL